MNNRSEALAARLEAGAESLAVFAAALSETEWPTVVPHDGRKVGVVVRHVASVYPIEIESAQSLVDRRPIVGVTWDAVHKMNHGHAQENDHVKKEAALALLATDSASAAPATRALSDIELDRAAPVSLNSDARSPANTCSRTMWCDTVIATWPRSGQRSAIVETTRREATMTQQLKLLAVLAHPDDESLGFGGTLAKYAAEGVETTLVTATRGERGRFGPQGKTADPAEVGRVREAELHSAAAVLGIRELRILGYPDGAVDQADVATAVRAITQHIRRVRPHVVVTFGPDGGYGHPDHIAISQFTTAAIVCAADTSYRVDSLPTHRVAKLHHMAWRSDKWGAYQAAFRKLTSMVDGVSRQATPWPDWAVTMVIDTSAYWPVVWKAVCCHRTQLSIYGQLEHLAEERQRALWGSQEFYRAYSAVNGGRKLETDLFEGLR